MPSELERVVRGLVECLDQLPQVAAALRRYAAQCRVSAAVIGQSTGNPAAARAALQLEEAAQRCEEAAHYADGASLKARDWAQQMLAAGRSGVGSAQRRGPEVTGGAGRVDPAAQAVIRGKLPVRDSPYAKTKGVWFDRDGEQVDLLSGHDDVREAAEDLRIRMKLAPTTVTAHVEVKFAMMMRERGLADETIYINNKPCEGPESCRRYLPVFLPPGARLTVHWPGAAPITFEGKASDELHG